MFNLKFDIYQKRASISDCSFIQKAENVFITGVTGCIKSFLACAIGRETCSKIYKFYFFGMSLFMDKISIKKMDLLYQNDLVNPKQISLF